MARGMPADDVFVQLKTLYDSQQTEEYVSLLHKEAQAAMDMELRKSVFALYRPSDREDARQEALMYLFSKMDAFMRDPRNDAASAAPDSFSSAQKKAWLHKTLYLGLLHSRDRVQKENYSQDRRQTAQAEQGKLIPIDSLDRSVTEEKGRTLADTIPSGEAAYEETLMLREEVQEACQALFSLPNSPELLAAVGFVILSETLGGRHRSLADYAALLENRLVEEVLGQIERLLLSNGLSNRVLLPLKERTTHSRREKFKGELRIMGITPKTLANRKNSMLNQLRKTAQEEEG